MTDITDGFLGVPAEELGGIGDFAARIRQRLAVLQRDQFRKTLGVAHDDLEGLAQNFSALARLLGGPGRERFLRGVDGALGVLNRGARHRSDDLFGRRIDDVEALIVG